MIAQPAWFSCIQFKPAGLTRHCTATAPTTEEGHQGAVAAGVAAGCATLLLQGLTGVAAVGGVTAMQS